MLSISLPFHVAGGMYTNTNPELRRIVPDTNGRTKIKVVYVVLEAQYQSALTKAVQNINGKRDNVSASLALDRFNVVVRMLCCDSSNVSQTNQAFAVGVCQNLRTSFLS